MIYLDNASTTFPKPEVVYKEVDFVSRNQAFNAGRGESKESLIAFNIREKARKNIASLASTNPNNVVFTASATDALNTVLFGLNFSSGDNIYISPFEHNATCRVLELLKEKGINVYLLDFDKKTWKPKLESIENSFALNKPKAIIISEVSNVTGYQIPYEEIFELGKKYNSINIVDAAQSFGLVNKDRRNADLLVFAGHKTLYGVFGIGGFINFANIDLKETRAGGTGSDSLNLSMPKGNPYKHEYGSPNILAAASLNASINWIMQNDIYKHEKELTNYLIKELRKISKIHMYLPENLDNHIGIVSINIDGYDCQDVGSILGDEFDISVRTGYHCAPFVHDFLDSIEYNGTIRISLGFFNKKEDIDKLIEALESF